MNKMNLPPPFEELEKDYPIVKEAYDVENYQDLLGVRIETRIGRGLDFFIKDKLY